MSLTSMTGFARAAGRVARTAWVWEIKSVNGRSLDIRTRVPPGFEQLAEDARQSLGKQAARGTINVLLTISADETAAGPRINEATLQALADSLSRIRLPEGIAPASLDGLLSVRGVVENGAEEVAVDALRAPLLAGLSEAAAAFVAARQAEGRQVQAALEAQLDGIARCVSACEAHPSRTADAIRERIAGQVAALLGATQALDPMRLHQEAAMIAVRADIREELDRLKAHLASAREMIAAGGAVGRRLDFLAQEFGREASTTCAKASDVELSAIGVELRTIVDQFREQVQNVE